MHRSRVVLLAVVVGAALAATGCEKPLFPSDLPRSPYERYMTLRGRSRPMSEETASGMEQPAIRERLKPLGAP